jgi:hypothetical protein
MIPPDKYSVKKPASPQHRFDRTPEKKDGERIENKMQPVRVHELKRQQLPDVTVFQTAEAQGKIFFFDFRAVDELRLGK